MKTTTLCAVMTILVAVTGIHAADEEERSELDGLRQKFEDAHLAIDLKFAEQRDAALVSYGKALDAYMEYLKKGGKLDSYLELEEEKTRFEAEQTVPPLKDRKNPYVTKAAARCDAAVSKATADRQKRSAYLVRQYVIRLESLIKDMMQVDRIEDAKLVRAELEQSKLLLEDMKPESSEPKRRAVPADAVEYEGHHYKLFGPKLISWTYAKASCEAMGGHLATFGSTKELQFLKKVRGKTAPWLGGSPGQLLGRDGNIYERDVSGDVPTAKPIDHYICEWDY